MRTILCVLLVVAMAFSTAVRSPAQADALTIDTILGAHEWLNATPTANLVRGKVVIVDFYTFGCINCQNIEPNLRALYRKVSRNDLIILGVHSPETAVERDRDNVIASLKEQGVVWPVAIDNDFKLWNLCGISAWPTQLIFDRAGALRHTVVGDSQDQVVDDTVQQLLKEK
ncbi:MAG: redoxin domain-containing protein [Candidatus Eremiobacteraeota bacterium]|nr:redoxin domain-containing protein [Candidatus Eremiobacteraeota bacterium]